MLEVCQSVIAVMSMSMLGVLFLFNWVILRTVTMSVGYPVPMFVEGSCICNEDV